MRLTAALILLSATALPAVGQPREPVEMRPLPADLSPNPDVRRVIVSRTQCRELQRHQPRGDVEYKPGVDVRGRPVAPADLGGGGGLAVPDTVSFDITVRLADFLRQAPRGISDSVARLGRIDVTGREVLFNGMPLTDPAVAEIAALCRAQIRD